MRSNLEPSIDRPASTDDRSGRDRHPSWQAAELRFVAHKQVLGGRFRFAGNNRPMLDLVEAAYGGLPPQALSPVSPEFTVELCLSPRRADPWFTEPPAPRIRQEGGRVHADVDAANHVAIDPSARFARIVASEDMLEHAYHLRCELIEFAVFILAARGGGLVPLHAACVGRQGRGVLLLGSSGAGKSTLALHCMLQGLDVLAEDAVFVRPADLLATGVPNYLHLRSNALDHLEDQSIRRWIACAPVIRRRSGIEKFEVDLRHPCGRFARNPLQLAGAVFVSNRRADHPGKLLTRLPAHEAGRLLEADQPYAPSQPGWRHFQREIVNRGIHQLRRGNHPRDSVDALRRLLD